MTPKTKGNIIYYVGLAVSIVAPLIAAATQFPVWTENVEPTQIGGMFVFVAILCMIPLFNHFKIALKSPSSAMLWTIMFVVTWALSKIIKQIVIVSLVGMISNIVGAILCGIGNHLRRPRGVVINGEIDNG